MKKFFIIIFLIIVAVCAAVALIVFIKFSGPSWSVDAGGDKTANSGQCVSLSGKINPPDHGAKSYSWDCSTVKGAKDSGVVNGTHSLIANYCDLKDITASTTVVCTFTVEDNSGRKRSDKMTIQFSPAK